MQAAEPSITGLLAQAHGRSVSVRFSLANGFRNGQTLQSLESGLPTSFTYVLEIFRDRPRWFDEGIGRSRIEVIATFNSVTREYLLNYRRDRKLIRSETFSNFAALQQRMTTIEERDLFDIGKRRPHKLKVRVKADLMRGWMFYIVPRAISTRWKEARVVAQEPRL